MKLCLLSVSEIAHDGGDALIGTFLTETGQTWTTRIIEIPHVVYTDVLTASQLRELKGDLEYKSKQVGCLDPSCGCSFTMVKEEEDKEDTFVSRCKQPSRPVYDPIVSSEVVYKYPFIGYKRDPSPKLKLVIRRADLTTHIVTFLRKYGLRAYNGFTSTVDHWNVLMGRGAFTWFMVPNQPVVEYKDIQKIEMDTMIYPSVLDLDIEVISPTYKTYETERAMYPVGVIGLTWKNQDIHFTWEPSGHATTDLQREYAMLETFFEWFRVNDPNVISGFNITGYDLPYLCKRAERLGFGKTRAHQWLSRYPDCPVRFQHLVVKNRDQTRIYIPGRLVMDVMSYAQSTDARISLHSYSLRNVSKHLNIPLEKEDVAPAEIYPLFHGTPAQRHRLIHYCNVDARLSGQCFTEMQMMYRLMGKSRFFQIQAQDAMYRAIGYCNWFIMHAAIEEHDMVYVPVKDQRGLAPELKAIEGYEVMHEAKLAGEKYAGAYVVSPTPGVYGTVGGGIVASYDFSSLYPSNLISDNASPDTALTSIEGADVVLPQIPGYTGQQFGFTRAREGVLPKVLRRGLAARNRIKELLNTATGMMKDVYKGEEQAIKLSNNSFYGMLGTLTTNMYMVSLAFCCTQQGVHRIQRVIRFVEEDTPEQKVIYGDTDSIFVFIPKTHPCQGWLRARELHDRIHDEKNKIMDRDTKMELENVSATMHALCKKKYILEILSKTAYERCATCGSGIPWHLEEDSGHLKPRTLKIQGVLNRSIPIYTQNLIKETYKRKYLLAQSPMKIYLWLRAELQKIKRGEVQRDEFRQSKCLSKPLSEYKGEQVHTRCAKMLQEAGIEVKVGDRIGYYTCIVAASSKKSQTCVPDELVDSFTIDWMQYLRDMLQTFEKVGFVDILGSGLFSNLQFVVQNGQTVGKISVGKRTETTGSFEDICRKRARPSLN